MTSEFENGPSTTLIFDSEDLTGSVSIYGEDTSTRSSLILTVK